MRCFHWIALHNHFFYRAKQKNRKWDCVLLGLKRQNSNQNKSRTIDLFVSLLHICLLCTVCRWCFVVVVCFSHVIYTSTSLQMNCSLQLLTFSLWTTVVKGFLPDQYQFIAFQTKSSNENGSGANAVHQSDSYFHFLDYWGDKFWRAEIPETVGWRGRMDTYSHKPKHIDYCIIGSVWTMKRAAVFHLNGPLEHE